MIIRSANDAMAMWQKLQHLAVCIRKWTWASSNIISRQLQGIRWCEAAWLLQKNSLTTRRDNFVCTSCKISPLPRQVLLPTPSLLQVPKYSHQADILIIF